MKLTTCAKQIKQMKLQSFFYDEEEAFQLWVLK